jgi:hypothetical protein
MCLTGGEILLAFLLTGLAYLGLSVLILFLLFKLFSRKNKLPYKLP